MAKTHYFECLIFWYFSASLWWLKDQGLNCIGAARDLQILNRKTESLQAKSHCWITRDWGRKHTDNRILMEKYFNWIIDINHIELLSSNDQEGYWLSDIIKNTRINFPRKLPQRSKWWSRSIPILQQYIVTKWRCVICCSHHVGDSNP